MDKLRARIYAAPRISAGSIGSSAPWFFPADVSTGSLVSTFRFEFTFAQPGRRDRAPSSQVANHVGRPILVLLVGFRRKDTKRAFADRPRSSRSPPLAGRRRIPPLHPSTPCLWRKIVYRALDGSRRRWPSAFQGHRKRRQALRSFHSARFPS